MDGLERLVVICVGLDQVIDRGAGVLQTRSRLYRAMTRAQLAVAVVNEALPGGWLEFLGRVELDDKMFDDAAERGNRAETAADDVVGAVVEETSAPVRDSVGAEKASNAFLDQSSPDPTKAATEEKHDASGVEEPGLDGDADAVPGTRESKESTDDTVEPMFSRGDYVEARFGGKEEWLPGLVARHEGLDHYEIHYVDGSKELNVSAALIRRLIVESDEATTQGGGAEAAASAQDDAADAAAADARARPAPVAEKAAVDADAATTPSEAEPIKVLQSIWDASAVATVARGDLRFMPFFEGVDLSKLALVRTLEGHTHQVRCGVRFL